jgi:hypothetical protein
MLAKTSNARLMPLNNLRARAVKFLTGMRGHPPFYATADGRLRSAVPRRRGLRRFRRSNGIGAGDAGIGMGGVTMSSGALSTSTVIGTGLSRKARNARPASVICQPASSRRTYD